MERPQTRRPRLVALMTYRAAYLHLVEALRAVGWSVRHRKMGKNDYGAIYHDRRLIVISNSLGWKDKLVVLGHECGHYMQLATKKWRPFILRESLFPNTPANRRYVEAAEIDASRRGKKLLLGMGFDLYFAELDKRQLPYLRELWYEEYLERE